MGMRLNVNKKKNNEKFIVGRKGIEPLIAKSY
jgi:hypothetical protein